MRLNKLLIILLFFGCSSKRATEELSGIYMTYKPNVIKQVLIEKRFKGSIFPIPAVLMYLRNDGTYVFGFCDNQICEVGKYEVEGDSILLSDRFSVETQRKKTPIYIYIERKNDILYLVTQKPPTDIDRSLNDMEVGKKNEIIPVMKNHKWAHLGFLRGQEMPYDSIVNYYKYQTVEEQDIWADSVLNSKKKI